MFEIGDIVTGLTEDQYAFTNSRGTFEVVSLDRDLIGVKVISHLDYRSSISDVYFVDPTKFRLVKSCLEEKISKKIAHLDSLFKNR
jgi:hypothetical protein